MQSIGKRFAHMAAFRRSRWHGSAFNVACCGENSCQSKIPISQSFGISAPLLTSPATQRRVCTWRKSTQPRAPNADALLIPALSSRDPEVGWRLADVLVAQRRFEGAEMQLEAARSGFDHLLGRHLYAFADHAAAFYAGKDWRRALDLARTNVANRPTRRAVRQAETIASNAGEAAGASEPNAVRNGRGPYDDNWEAAPVLSENVERRR
jgi:hypothetical protein